jgi:hypothetical protein
MSATLLQISTMTQDEANAFFAAIGGASSDFPAPGPSFDFGTIAPITGSGTLAQNSSIEPATGHWSTQTLISAVNLSASLSGFDIDASALGANINDVNIGQIVQTGIVNIALSGTEMPDLCSLSYTLSITNEFVALGPWSDADEITSDNPAVQALSSPGTNVIGVVALVPTNVISNQTQAFTVPPNAANFGVMVEPDTGDFSFGPGFGPTATIQSVLSTGATVILPFDINDNTTPCDGAGGQEGVGPDDHDGGAVYRFGSGAIYATIAEIQQSAMAISIGGGVSFGGDGGATVRLAVQAGGISTTPGPLPVSLPCMPCMSRCFQPF